MGMMDLGAFADSMTDIDVTTTIVATDVRNRRTEKPIVTRLYGYYIIDTSPTPVATLTPEGMRTSSLENAELIGPMNDILKPGLTIQDVNTREVYRIQGIARWRNEDIILASLATA